MPAPTTVASQQRSTTPLLLLLRLLLSRLSWLSRLLSGLIELKSVGYQNPTDFNFKTGNDLLLSLSEEKQQFLEIPEEESNTYTKGDTMDSFFDSITSASSQRAASSNGRVNRPSRDELRKQNLDTFGVEGLQRDRNNNRNNNRRRNNNNNNNNNYNRRGGRGGRGAPHQSGNAHAASIPAL